MTIKDINKLDWDGWLYGLGSAAISGGASAVTSGLAAMGLAPETFNLDNPALVLKLAAVCFGINAFLSIFIYLKTKPLPEVEE